MRIAIVTESFLPRVDGVSRSVGALLRHCRRRGHEALVVAPGHGPHESEGFQVIRVMGVPGLYPGLVMSPLAPGLRGLFQRFAPDVVHLASPALLGATAVRAGRRAGVPVAAHFQTDVPAYAGHYGGGLAVPAVWAWMRRLHNGCAATYAPTPTLAAELRRRGFRNVSVSGRGVDLESFRPGRPGAQWARGLWPAPGGDGPRVLCVARLAPEKSLDRLLEVARRHPALRVLLVGAGPDEARLRRLMPANVRLAGLLEGDALGDVYSAADMFAFPSSTETFGQVVQEAMASGLPVVGMRAGGVADLIADGVDGLLTEPGGDAFEAAVARLAADPAARRRLGAAARRRVEPRSWATVLDGLLQDYARLGPERIRRPSAAAGRPARGRAAAFMDVDRTLLRGSSFLALAAPMARAGVISRRSLVRAAAHQVGFAALGAGEARLARAAQRGASVVAGVEVDRLRAVGRRAVQTHLAPLVYPAARRLIGEHHAAGEAVYLVSSAPEDIVGALAQLVGADGFVASRPEVVDGRLTGRLLRLVQGREKVRALHELAELHGLDLRRCTAYGDSGGDAGMLAAVGRGVCVNPDSRLRGLAALRGWEILHFAQRARAPRALGGGGGHRRLRGRGLWS